MASEDWRTRSGSRLQPSRGQRWWAGTGVEDRGKRKLAALEDEPDVDDWPEAVIRRTKSSETSDAGDEGMLSVVPVSGSAKRVSQVRVGDVLRVRLGEGGRSVRQATGFHGSRAS